MGFLSGVLGAVKNENEVTTYDKDPSNDINKLISDLNNKIGSGRAGLVASVAEVKGWLEKYSSFVDAYSNAVTVPLNNIIQSINNRDENIRVNSLAEQQKEWQQQVGKHGDQIKYAKKAAEQLDKKLQNELEYSMGIMESAVKMLYESAKNGILEHHLLMVDTELLSQKAHLENALRKETTKLEETLEDGYQNILKQFGNLRIEEREQFASIRSGLSQTRNAIKGRVRDFDMKFRDVIIKKLEAIATAVHDLNKGGNADSMSKLKRNVNGIRTALLTVGGELQRYIVDLGNWMDKANKIVHEVRKNHVEEILRISRGGPGSKRVVVCEYIDEIRDKIKPLVELVRNQITDAVAVAVEEARNKIGPLEKAYEIKLLSVKNDVEGAVEKITHAVEKLYKEFVPGNGAAKGKKVKDIVEHIKSKVKEVKDGDGKTFDGLKGIKDKIVTDWGKRFSNSVDFKKKVEEWIGMILRKDSVINWWLDKYFNGNTSKFKSPGKGKEIETVTSTNIGKIAGAISVKLDPQIKPAQVAFAKAQGGGSVSETATAVKAACNTFADELDDILKEGGIDTLVNSLVDLIDAAVEKTGKSTVKDNLESALYRILPALSATAREAAKSLEEFALSKGRSTSDPSTTDLASNLDKALTVVTEFEDRLVKAAAFSAISSDYFGNVDNAINDVKDTVKSIKGNVSSVNVDGMQYYGHTTAKENLDSALDAVKYSASGITVEQTTDALDTLSDKIKVHLKALTTAFSETGRQINVRLYGLQSKNIDVDLRKILNDLNTLQSNELSTNMGRMQNAINTAVQILETLENVPGQVENAKKVVDTLLKEIKRELEVLDGNINHVELRVDDADNALKNAIKILDGGITQAHAENKKTVSHLKTTVFAQIENSFRVLISQVRTLFADAHKADLSALRSLVDQQLKAVQAIIDKDRVTGVKGMLKTLSGVPADHKGVVSDDNNMFTKIKNVLLPLPQPRNSPPSDVKKFSQVCPHVELYLRSLFAYFAKETERLFKPLAKEENKYHKMLEDMYHQMKDFFDHIAKKNYDYKFVDLLSQLNLLVSTFPAETLPDAPKSVLAPLKSGLSNFAEQLGHAYVNRYSGGKFEGDLVTTSTPKPSVPAEKQEPPKVELTPEGRNCAKVCLTIVEMVNDGLEELKKKCNDKWSAKKLNGVSSLGSYLKRNGYKVPTRDYVQDGELRNTGEMTGQDIIAQLFRPIESTNNNEHFKKCKKDDEYESEERKKKFLAKPKFSLMDVLDCLFRHIRQYNEVGHYVIHAKPRTPCNVYEMLVWFTGLMYNRAYVSLLHDGFTGLLEKPKKPIVGEDDGFDLAVFQLESCYVDTYPHRITYGNIKEVIEHLCTNSHELLAAILGTGDEHTTYTCDYSNNSLGLYYPQKGDDCLHTILDILRRLFPVLSFLHSQCSFGASDMGWADCRYGKDIPTTKSHCSKESKGKAKCQAECQPNYQPNCQPTSPLMCYLGDSLLGCLPHRVESIGCSSKCATCPSNKPGMPCLTPLGFRSFSGSTKTGSDLCEVVSKFFERHVASCLFSLVAKPPSTLPEHFGFALSLVKRWDDSRSHLIKEGITSAITDRSIAIYEQTSDLTNALSNAYGSSRTSHDAVKYHVTAVKGNDEESKKGDLCSLAMSNACSGDNVHCAPYLNALCADQYAYLASKQCNAYLSWAVYLPWTFWNYLASLYDAFKDIYCQDWGCRTCLRADTCRRGQHGLVNDKTNAPNCHCSSIVECKGAMPMLYKHGFTFGAPAALNGQGGKKTCTNFMDQLNNVLRSTYFKTLFDKCDNFLWTIRTPFSYLILTLWLLSLLYLLHIMVIRLDLLHIKSHLHSPSSHRIAAQSLLAAGRVNKLNRVFYLQP